VSYHTNIVDLVEAILEETNGGPTVLTGEPFAVSPKPHPTNQTPGTKLDKASSAMKRSIEICMCVSSMWCI